MALPLAAFAFIGAIAFDSQRSTSVINKNIPAKPLASSENQINEDIDKIINPHTNIKFANSVYSDEVAGIIRSDNYDDLRDVRNNALDFVNRARIKNRELGLINFRTDTKSTVLLPSYGTAIQGVIVPNPDVMPGYKKIPNAWLDKETSAIRLDQRPWLYKNPYGENIRPYNSPNDIVQQVNKFGNPWGPGGLFNTNMREGGRRLDNTHDYNPKYFTEKRVRFSTPLYSYS